MALSNVCILFVDKLSPIIILPVSWTLLTAAVSPTAEDWWPVVDITKGAIFMMAHRSCDFATDGSPTIIILISMQHHEQLNHASPVIQHNSLFHRPVQPFSRKHLCNIPSRPQAYNSGRPQVFRDELQTSQAKKKAPWLSLSIVSTHLDRLQSSHKQYLNFEQSTYNMKVIYIVSTMCHGAHHYIPRIAISCLYENFFHFFQIKYS